MSSRTAGAMYRDLVSKGQTKEYFQEGIHSISLLKIVLLLWLVFMVLVLLKNESNIVVDSIGFIAMLYSFSAISDVDWKGTCTHALWETIASYNWSLVYCYLLLEISDFLLQVSLQDPPVSALGCVPQCPFQELVFSTIDLTVSVGQHFEYNPSGNIVWMGDGQ